MSGEDIPYQLRPNKFIDRQMFIELLSRLIHTKGPEKYVYVSMGGRHLIDHVAVYNQLGIDAQYSFDKNPNEVKRQKFNRPTGKTVCVELDSAELPSKIDSIFAAFPSKRNMIVWLDYTDSNRTTQFQEAIQTLVRLKHGDIFRLTLNAANNLCVGDEWKKAGAAGPGEHRATKLREQISEYMPTRITSLGEDALPNVLAQCVELAVKAAESQRPDIRIEPVLLTSYRDGVRMLTVTCSISEVSPEEPFPPVTFRRWRYRCRGWDDIHSVFAPVLSLRERNRLDARLHRGASDMLAALSFLPSESKKKSLEALKSYREFHRFYPSFRSVDE